MKEITVICPFYGVEKFIAHCAETLMCQTIHDKVEYIFVDDAGPDRSAEVLANVLEKYPGRDVRVLKHAVNKGLPAARNTGLKEASGKYIYHCDSDDFLETDALERLLAAAENCDADVVWSDYWLSFNTYEKYMRQPGPLSANQALSAMMSGTMKYNVWNKLVKRSLYEGHSITFPEGYPMGEDMTMMMLFVHACRTAYVPSALYHYVRFNPSAMTGGGDCRPEHMDILEHNLGRVSNYLQEQVGDKIIPDINYMKLNCKWPLLLDGNRDSYQRWKSVFVSADKYIMSSPVSFRMRFLEWSASKGLYFIVKLHYLTVVRMYYGLRYRK